MYYVLSILLGLVPEVIYFTLFLIYTKNLKEKRLWLFIGMSVIYFICLIIQRYKIAYYLGFVVLVYSLLKLLYKNKVQIIDIFTISIPATYITLLSCLMWALIMCNRNYYVYYILYGLNRILLFLPFIFRKRFNPMYKKYCSWWNRNDNIKKPIKSITLRNISLTMVNLCIVIINITIQYILL